MDDRVLEEVDLLASAQACADGVESQEVLNACSPEVAGARDKYQQSGRHIGTSHGPTFLGALRPGGCSTAHAER